MSGAAEVGLEVQARDSKKTEYKNDPVYSGSAGGFGGALLNGSVKDSEVTNPSQSQWNELYRRIYRTSWKERNRRFR